MIDRKKKSTSSSSTGSGITDIIATQHEQFPIETLSYIKDGETTAFTKIIKSTDIIEGGVNWIEGLEFSLSAFLYEIHGELCTSAPTKKTLSAADPLLPRIDIFILDNTGNSGVIEGTPADNPQKPTCDPETQVEITHVLIPAGATTPAGITQVVIYNENVEWTGSAVGTTCDFNSITDPFQGAKCAEITNISKGNSISFITDIPVIIKDFNTFLFNLKLKQAVDKQYFLTVKFKLNGLDVSGQVNVPFNLSSLTWQTLTLELTSIKFNDTKFDQVVFIWQKVGANVVKPGFYLDFIKLESGISQPVVTGDAYKKWILKGGSGIAVEYGNMYNSYAARDPRNIASIGYEVPELSDIIQFILYLDAGAIVTPDVYGAGKNQVTSISATHKIREIGNAHWLNTSLSTNVTKFTAKGGGYRTHEGVFANLKEVSMIITRSLGSTNQWAIFLQIQGGEQGNPTINGYTPLTTTADERETCGGYLRLLKTNPTAAELALPDGSICDPYIGNDGRVYSTIKIGNQVWTEYLCETRYRNGDAIPNVTDNSAWAALNTGAYCIYDNSISNAYSEIAANNLFNVETQEIVHLSNTQTVQWQITEDSQGQKIVKANAVAQPVVLGVEVLDANPADLWEGRIWIVNE